MRLASLWGFLLLSLLTYGQKEDYVWLSGYQSSLGYDSLTHEYLGITKMDFNNSPRSITYDSLGIDFCKNGVSYCDTSGSLVLYSNGLEVRNKWDEVIEGDSLGVGYYTNQYGYLGTVFNRSVILLPIPDTTNQYIILYSFIDTLPGNLVELRNRILSAYIDMNANNGHGKVIYKDRIIVSDDSLSLMPNLAAVKHGNGRDWWVLVKQNTSNCFHKILIDKKGATLLPTLECLGDSTLYQDFGSLNFSPDGNFLAMLNVSHGAFQIDPNAYAGIHLYRFDRCSGNLSLPMFLPLPTLIDSALLVNDVVFSPNSKYLYAMLMKNCLQFDLSAVDIWGSVDTVAIYDGFEDPFGSSYCYSQLGPDGKIYISTGNTERNYSYIDSPNIKGRGCAFRAHTLHTPSYQNSVPNFPNYRLGRLVGSICDTLHTDLKEIETWRINMLVYPNPTHELITVDYGSVDWSTREELQLHVTDVVGRELYSTSLSRFSAINKIITADFASGMYLVSLTDVNGQVLSSQKVVKE